MKKLMANLSVGVVCNRALSNVRASKARLPECELSVGAVCNRVLSNVRASKARLR